MALPIVLGIVIGLGALLILIAEIMIFVVSSRSSLKKADSDALKASGYINLVGILCVVAGIAVFMTFGPGKFAMMGKGTNIAALAQSNPNFMKAVQQYLSGSK